MAKEIGDLVNGSKSEQKSIDEANSQSAQNEITLEDRLNSVGRAVKSVGKLAFTGGILAATYGMIGKSALFTAGGNGLGYAIEKIKSKGKIKSDEIHKEIRTGGIMGVLGYKLYSLIDFIPNYNLPMKIVKAVAFNPIMLAPYVAFYQAFTYLRDKVGAGKTALGLVNLKIFKYLKDAYQNEIKPNFGKSMKKIMYLSPIHFGSINYIKDVPTRVAIGVGNDIAFRLFQSQKKESDSYTPSAKSLADYNKKGYGTLNPAYT